MQQLSTIKQKLQQLIKQQQLLQKENMLLKDNLQKANALNQQQTIVLQELKTKLDAAQINTSSLNNQDKKALEKRIDIYLKDIETSIALLNKE